MPREFESSQENQEPELINQHKREGWRERNPTVPAQDGDELGSLHCPQWLLVAIEILAKQDLLVRNNT